MESGDQRRDAIVLEFLNGLLAAGWKPPPGALEVIHDAAAQIQASTDLLFHGAMTTVDEIITGHDSAVCRFAAEIILAEIMDHGFEIHDDQGRLRNVDKTITKNTGAVRTTWKK